MAADKRFSILAATDVPSASSISPKQKCFTTFNKTEYLQQVQKQEILRSPIFKYVKDYCDCQHGTIQVLHRLKFYWTVNQQNYFDDMHLPSRNFVSRKKAVLLMKFHTVVNNTSKPLAPEFKYLRTVIKWPSSTPDIQHFQHNTVCC